METIYVPAEGVLNLRPFVAKLKKLKDKRDNRGKRHELDFVLASVALGRIQNLGGDGTRQNAKSVPLLPKIEASSKRRTCNVEHRGNRA